LILFDPLVAPNQVDASPERNREAEASSRRDSTLVDHTLKANPAELGFRNGDLPKTSTEPARIQLAEVDAPTLRDLRKLVQIAEIVVNEAARCPGRHSWGGRFLMLHGERFTIKFYCLDQANNPLDLDKDADELRRGEEQ
jgi:hypothetical protein